jgi:hypothetical protein
MEVAAALDRDAAPSRHLTYWRESPSTNLVGRPWNLRLATTQHCTVAGLVLRHPKRPLPTEDVAVAWTDRETAGKRSKV